MSAAEPEQPEPEKQDLMALLTPEERRFVLIQRAVEVLYQLQETIIHPHWNESYLNLCRGDTGLMAVHYGWCAAYVSVLEMVVSPLVAQLSDRFGRRHFGSWGRIGWIIFFSGHRIRDRSLTHRLWFEAIPWGIIQAGTWPVFAAAHSDVFGERPQLSARIKSRDGMYISIAGVCGPIVTVLVSRTVGLAATEHLCSVLAGASIVLQLANKETLTPAKRKPFSLSQANPFANVHLLFTNGPGLRRLASSTSLWFWCNEIWSTQAAFRMGVLRWTPIQTGIFDCIYHLTETVAHKPLVDPILKACSNRSAFEIGALLSALAYLVQSFSWWSAAGAASKLRMSLQYGVGICLLTTVPVTMKYTMRAMVVAQGINVNPNVGRGQLNSAYGGLGQITAIFSGLFWGGLYRFFSSSAQGTPWWLRWGPGGHFLVTTALLCGAWGILKTTSSKDLFLEDQEEEGGAEQKQE